MLFILLSSLFIHTHSKFITYTLYQTDDLCQYNWKESICMRSFFLNQTTQPLIIPVTITETDHCPSRILVYIRSRQCIYCAKTYADMHCNHRRLRRMIPRDREHLHRNTIVIVGLSLFGVFIIGSLFTLLFIKRSQAHTNLVEYYDTQRHLQAIKQSQLPRNIKSTQIHSSQPKHLIIPQAKI